MANKWLRYCWDLKTLPETQDEIPSPLILRAATQDEIHEVLKVVTSSFSMDTGWADIHKPLIKKLTEQIETAFAEKEPLSVVLQYGQRLIGASILTADEDAGMNNLITGPCILHEYRSRGYGSSLLRASLAALREAGLSRAYGVSRDKTVASRFLYTKFGSKVSEWVSDLDTPPKVAA